jgi:hypothetical protein
MQVANSQVRRFLFVAVASFSSTISVFGSNGSTQISNVISGHESR